MYSRERFSAAKSALADVLLTLPDYRLSLEESVEAEFLENLLSDLVVYGEISQKTIESALDAVWGVLECLSEEDADIVLADLQEIGEYYIGKLSEKQRREIARLHDKCMEYLESPNNELLREIEELM